MPTYYHIQRKSVPRLKIGHEYAFGDKQNFFTRDLWSTKLSIPLRGIGNMAIDEIMNDYFDDCRLNHYRRIAKEGQLSEEDRLLACARSVLKHQAMVMREFVFERVRTEQFPEKPSRMCCAWLIPHDLATLELWASTAPKNQFHAFEVDAEGLVHVGDTKFLRPNSLSVVELSENAKLYWSSNISEMSGSAELVFAGKMKVTRELHVTGSERSTWAKIKSLF